MTCFVFCGADVKTYEEALEELTPLLSKEYCLALMPEDSTLDLGQGRVVRDSSLGSLDFLRSALGQADAA